MTPPRYAPLGTLMGDKDVSPELETWRRSEPALAEIESFEELIMHLRSAAASRKTDEVITALCRLWAAGAENLPGFLLFEGFVPELAEMAAGAGLLGREIDLRSCYAVLSSVVEDAVSLGEEVSGRTLMSRIWARAFQPAAPGTAGVLRAEIEAAAVRAYLFARGIVRSLRGRRIADRIACRLSPLTEAIQVKSDSSLTGKDLGELCVERGLSPRIVRRQLAEVELVGERAAEEISSLSSRLTEARAAVAEETDETSTEDEW